MARARLSLRLNGLLAGLFALVILQVPAQHLRMVSERTAVVAAHAAPHGHLPEISSGHGGATDGHDRHLLRATCLACVLAAAPGLAAAPFTASELAPVAVAARLRAAEPALLPGAVDAARRARAPPQGPTA